MSNCSFCGNSFEGKIYKSTLCPSCGKEMKICLNCVHYDSSAYHECRESQAEFVQDKERANFCDYFTADRKNAGKPNEKAENARQKFEDLFN
jgi:hypothetical protein